MSEGRRRLVEDPISFWDQRHRDFDPWRSGGDRGLTEEENQEFYDLRVAQILTLIRKHQSTDRSLRVLDAGCGRGHLTEALRSVGHVVVGMDSSESAVEAARAAHGGDFRVSTLQQFVAPFPFNVVVCMDVLFHVLDDQAWRDSIRALCESAAAESCVLVSDELGSTRRQIHDYIVHRSRDEYESAFAWWHYTLAEFVSYDYGLNPNGFAVFKRRV